MQFPRRLKPWVLPLFAALSLSACLSEAGPTLSAPEARDQVQAGAITLGSIAGLLALLQIPASPSRSNSCR